ncbi:hypothetical protein QGP82_04010 [Leptothoe sp. LEGE 181152]|nr:hypothetical protein [Leptothoe sp. LEGE 181152]
MEDFYRYDLSRQDLNVRAAHSLCRAGWMLVEINGVLKNGCISVENFQRIQEQATTLEKLQRKFGPPPKLSRSTEINVTKINIHQRPTLLVMNRGVEEAASILSHHGWHLEQIRSVLKPAIPPLDDIGFALLHDLQVENHRSHRPRLTPPHPSPRRNAAATTLKAFTLLVWLGGLIFIGVSLILHVL